MDGKSYGVSFVVTVFNKERHLEATLRSVLDQEGDFERQVIVVAHQHDHEIVHGHIPPELRPVPVAQIVQNGPNGSGAHMIGCRLV